MKWYNFIFAFIIGSILCLLPILNKQFAHGSDNNKKNYQLEPKQLSIKIDSDPSVGKINKDGSVTFDRYGTHFTIGTKVNGVPITFMLDTGASRVLITRTNAMDLGINLENLQYKIKMRTANGINFVAPVVFDSIQIGNILVKNVRGYIAKDSSAGSLLGMSFLNRLSKYEIKKEGSITFWQ